MKGLARQKAKTLRCESRTRGHRLDRSQWPGPGRPQGGDTAHSSFGASNHRCLMGCRNLRAPGQRPAPPCLGQPQEPGHVTTCGGWSAAAPGRTRGPWSCADPAPRQLPAQAGAVSPSHCLRRSSTVQTSSLLSKGQDQRWKSVLFSIKYLLKPGTTSSSSQISLPEPTRVLRRQEGPHPQISSSSSPPPDAAWGGSAQTHRPRQRFASRFPREHEPLPVLLPMKMGKWWFGAGLDDELGDRAQCGLSREGLHGPARELLRL